jgi:hypothetical protein
MSTILNNASMIIDIDCKEGSWIMVHQGNQEPEVETMSEMLEE